MTNAEGKHTAPAENVQKLQFGPQSNRVYQLVRCENTLSHTEKSTNNHQTVLGSLEDALDDILILLHSWYCSWAELSASLDKKQDHTRIFTRLFTAGQITLFSLVAKWYFRFLKQSRQFNRENMLHESSAVHPSTCCKIKPVLDVSLAFSAATNLIWYCKLCNVGNNIL